MLRFFWIILIISGLSFALINKDKLLSFYSKNNANSSQSNNQPGVIQGVDYITTNNYANTHLNFYYYIPLKAQKNKGGVNPILVLVPGLSGSGEAFTTQAFKDFADQEGFILLSPSFMYDNSYSEIDKGTSYQYPAVWSGMALLWMIQKIQDKGYTLSKLYLFGFSAGAQYCLRFTLWHPDYCIASATQANGGYPIVPNQKNSVKYFVTVGTQDEKYRQQNAIGFYNAAKQLGMDASFKEYPVGHSLPDEQIADSLNFFKSVKNSPPTN